MRKCKQLFICYLLIVIFVISSDAEASPWTTSSNDLLMQWSEENYSCELMAGEGDCDSVNFKFAGDHLKMKYLHAKQQHKADLTPIIQLLLLDKNEVEKPVVTDLLFRSGFDQGTAIKNLFAEWEINYWRILGADTRSKYDWTADINSIDITKISLAGGLYGNYDNTWGSHALAEITSDPDNASNRVLRYVIPDTPYNQAGWYQSARVSSAILYNSEGNTFSQGYIKYRMRLGAGFQALMEIDGVVDWLVLSELFQYSAPGCQCARWNLNVHKNQSVGSPIFWRLSGQQMKDCGTPGEYLWREANTEVAIPIETWFTLEMYFKKGFGSEGKFWVAITLDGQSRQIIFDVNNHTQHPVESGHISDWAIFKLYLDGGIAHNAAANGTPLEIHYDDFEYWNEASFD